MRLQATINRLDKLFQASRSPRLVGAIIHHHVLVGAEHRPVLTRELSTVIDIGANRGQFALAARQWAPGARVISFEPLPGPAAVFRRVFSGDAAVVLHEAALGPRPGQATMHVSARDDSSSLLPISSLQSEMFPGTAEVATTTVRVAPLDTFMRAEDLAAPVMLKIDVQGFELEVLHGSESLLGNMQYVYVECSFMELYEGQASADDVVKFLHERKFSLRGIHNLVYDKAGRSVQGDFLFEKGGTE